MTPVAAWFVYSLVVGLLVGLAAWVGEAALRAAGRPGRWAWAWGMGLTVSLPVVAVLASMGWTRPVPGVAGAAIPLVPLAVAVTGPGAAGVSVDAMLLAGWAMMALAGLLWVHWAHRRLERGGAAGQRVRVGGIGVVVTRSLGPAVFGVRRAEILVPEWALGLDLRFRRLMLLHEGEHARAGDGRLALAGLLLAAAVPWNVALWWQLGRLRTAVELDCDERVLRRVRDPLNYGGLLLEVGRRQSGPVVSVALAERTTMLELRLRRITEAARRSVRRAWWLGGLAGVLLAVAMCTRDPMAGPVQPVPPAAVVPPQDRGALMQGPVFTPFTVAPRLTNADEAMRALERAYPPLLKQAGIEGSVNLWFFIDEEGRVGKVQVNQTSGYPALDAAAMSVGSIMRFTPAYNRDRTVPVWVSIPVVFNAVQAEKPAKETEPALPLPPPPPTSGGKWPQERAQIEKAPTFTPFTVAPRLRNQPEVVQSLESHYPPLLRSAGIGGSVNVWLFIDERGGVLKMQVNESSGYPALDEAALRVAAAMQFTPARNRDEPVAVWVSIPIVFSPK